MCLAWCRITSLDKSATTSPRRLLWCTTDLCGCFFSDCEAKIVVDNDSAKRAGNVALVQSSASKVESHFVWVVKCRYHILQGDLAIRVRGLIRQICKQMEFQILRVGKEHVQILVSALSQIGPSESKRRVKKCMLLNNFD